MNTSGRYCLSRFQAIRRKTREVEVGNVCIGGKNPIRIQSMTNTLTTDTESTTKQVIALAEAGCEIVRITAPNKQAARALKEIQHHVRAAKIEIPLVADIHFLPQAAMEAIEHVEKVRINPGNYADKKKFNVREYNDSQYQEELERLYKAFSPLILRAKELGRALRIGTNHGSLSDRIMNRYGDTPSGMVESALEFARIARSHNFHNFCFSFKASNPKVMLQAYRLSVELMGKEGMDYPLHLGVTEAGDGEDARIKSAIGIGALLYDGIGDTIRVSLTEDPVYEIPVAQDLAKQAMALWEKSSHSIDIHKDTISPYEYTRRKTDTIDLGKNITVDHQNAPKVIVAPFHPIQATDTIIKDVCQTQNKMTESKIEGLLFKLKDPQDLVSFDRIQKALSPSIPFFILELENSFPIEAILSKSWCSESRYIICRSFTDSEQPFLQQLLAFCEEYDIYLAINSLEIDAFIETISHSSHIIHTLSKPIHEFHSIGSYRLLAEKLKTHNLKGPIWIRNTEQNQTATCNYFSARLLESSIFSGSLLCDGIGDLISIETEPLLDKAVTLGYNILQGTRLRMTKTEYVACPSCGRTLFDLETTTQKIKEKTGHLKGVTIAVMGCIVNGPGEMADADFGYVGGAPKKVNLYVGKECVQYHIPEEEAVDRLIDLIKTHKKWVEPSQTEVVATT